MTNSSSLSEVLYQGPWANEIRPTPEVRLQRMKDYKDAIETIRYLGDDEFDQLTAFSKGINTIKELPEHLAAIALGILKQRHIFRNAILDWIPKASFERRNRK